MQVDQKLVDAAINLIKYRYPADAVWEGAAAMYTDKGLVLTSTFADAPNPSASLCHETGAICEAHKFSARIVASVCVSRAEDGSFHIVAPCGICQERLYFWGGEVEVGVPIEGSPQRWHSLKLSDVHRYYWRKPYITT